MSCLTHVLTCPRAVWVFVGPRNSKVSGLWEPDLGNPSSSFVGVVWVACDTVLGS